MMHPLMKFLVGIIVLFLPLDSQAETVKFRHIISVYADEKGSGLKGPEGITCDEKSLLIVADSGNGRLLQYSFHGGKLAGGVELKVPELSYPIRVQVNSKGEIFALDGRQHRIVRMNPKGMFNGYLEPGGLPFPTTIITRSFRIDKNDIIYVLDILSGRVWILESTGKYMRHVEFPENYGFFSDLAVDSKGNILLLDSTNIMIFSATKDSKTFSPFTKGMKELMTFPTSITTDNRGNIYLIDQNGGSVVLLLADGSFQGRIWGMGWKEGLLRYPSQLCINERGEAFIADRDNNRIQIFVMIK